jgi:hypothetical protein
MKRGEESDGTKIRSPTSVRTRSRRRRPVGMMLNRIAFLRDKAIWS